MGKARSLRCSSSPPQAHFAGPCGGFTGQRLPCARGAGAQRLRGCKPRPSLHSPPNPLSFPLHSVGADDLGGPRTCVSLPRLRRALSASPCTPNRGPTKWARFGKEKQHHRSIRRRPRRLMTLWCCFDAPTTSAARRRHKLHIARFRLRTKARSLRCSSFAF